MEERRRENEKNWIDFHQFMTESRDYRARDEVTQKYQVENIEALKNQVQKQNGRVFSLEQWREVVEAKIKQRKDSNSNIQSLITVISTVIMAVSALVMYFKK